MGPEDAADGGLQVREAHHDEHTVVADVTVAAYVALLGADGVGGYERELRDVDARASHGRVIVAVLDERVVGAVAYVGGPHTPFSEFDDDDASGIRMLAVEPSHQGRGIGRALTEACLRQARADGRRLVVLHSTDKMSIARGLYERLGFARAPGRDVVIPGEEMPDGEPFTLLAYVLELGTASSS